MGPLEVGWLSYVIMYFVTLRYTAVGIQVRIIYYLCIVIRILKHLCKILVYQSVIFD